MSSSPLDIPLERAVWTYHREGIDYGPFSSEEIIEQLREDELTRTDVLLEHSTNKVLKIEQVPDFLPALEKSEKRRWDQALDRETKRSFTEIRRGQRRRPALVAALIIALGLGGWYALQLTKSGFTKQVAYALVPVTPQPDQEFVAFATIKKTTVLAPKGPKPAKKRTNAKRNNRQKTNSVRATAPEPVVTTIDFSDPEVMNGSAEDKPDGPAPLGHSEFQRYRNELHPKLLNCIRNHNTDLDAGSYRLSFKVDGSGSATKVQLIPASPKGSALKYCANTLLRMNRLRAFTGSPRDLSLSFEVGSTRH